MTHWENDTTSKQMNNIRIQTRIKQLIQNEGDVVSVMDDGYCMFWAIGKIPQNQPGEMMKEVCAHMLSMNSFTEYYPADREVTKESQDT